jgi:hypothetical protein
MVPTDFIALLARLDPNVCKTPPDALLHMVAFMVAADRWIKEQPDNGDAFALRIELKYFLEHKQFSWQWKPSEPAISDIARLRDQDDE